MISPNPDLLGLFPDAARHRPLSSALPPGRPVRSRERPESPLPALWLSGGPAPAGLWTRLRAEHASSGLWPLLLDALDDEDPAYRPWGSGELTPAPSAAAGAHDPAVVLERWWAAHTGEDPEDQLTPAQRLAVTAPFGRAWPGLAPARVPTNDPGRVADDLAGELLRGHGSLRLGLVAADRGADALTVAGWRGAAGYVDDTAELSAVLRSWESRFGAQVVGVGSGTLLLSVAAPPTTLTEALAIAVEHFAVCPDNVWQSDEAHPLMAYAERLVGDHSWTFWWE
ncbi:DUF4253 domain-containing protein [Actinosynnema mirum]|uniref:DUF4253 domain-containing protein n=1 Tax=Actinosynnema mirum (strain ATCC 29888 / DSM 43827 / JCM 3225 / NBRC 14064 / NCIMB 13271 / NRRL B-12336 / IMRU 3971 / 101) TaxID=446462 RepID=C6WP67_ACTMD|nr:DUF4253 domain-containing protein [Actinosynnema mirum]ACU38569.1 hypothetical protein Amir_4740 [Actinosynnema mirum DSM 43827]